MSVSSEIFPATCFRPITISLLDATYTNVTEILTAQQVTDTYLLALAAAHGGQLAPLIGDCP
ncbi:MAG: hypothetical protein NVS2B5_19460 [Beijerinckiaceae bacterium]